MTIPAKPLRVLLVDDEPAILRMFRAALHGTKFTFSQAHDGREALERLGVTEVDVVVTDINMPGQGGLEFLRSMRGSHPHIPVIVMTGKPSSESQNEASIHGAVRYLVKPVLPATLRDAIESGGGARDGSARSPRAGGPRALHLRDVRESRDLGEARERVEPGAGRVVRGREREALRLFGGVRAGGGEEGEGARVNRACQW